MLTERLGSRQSNVERLITEIAGQIPRFGYTPISESRIANSKWRRIKRVNYKVNSLGSKFSNCREILEDTEGSYNLALTPDQQIIYLLQVRPGIYKPYQIELPAGSVLPGQSPLQNACKELAEEAGSSTLTDPIWLGTGPVLSGRSSQETHFYVTRNIVFDPASQNLNGGEAIYPFTVPAEESLLFSTTVMMNRNNPNFPDIGIDPKVITAIVLAAQFFQNKAKLISPGR